MTVICMCVLSFSVRLEGIGSWATDSSRGGDRIEVCRQIERLFGERGFSTRVLRKEALSFQGLEEKAWFI